MAKTDSWVKEIAKWARSQVINFTRIYDLKGTPLRIVFTKVNEVNWVAEVYLGSRRTKTYSENPLPLIMGFLITYAHSRGYTKLSVNGMFESLKNTTEIS